MSNMIFTKGRVRIPWQKNGRQISGEQPDVTTAQDKHICEPWEEQLEYRLKQNAFQRRHLPLDCRENVENPGIAKLSLKKVIQSLSATPTTASDNSSKQPQMPPPPNSHLQKPKGGVTSDLGHESVHRIQTCLTNAERENKNYHRTFPWLNTTGLSTLPVGIMNTKAVSTIDFQATKLRYAPVYLESGKANHIRTGDDSCSSKRSTIKD
jgi:hypothetical protein